MSDVATLDVRAFRKALGAFVTGVTVVTTTAPDGSLRGFTANSFTSVSLDPPLVLVCLARSAASASVFAAARHFAVSVLAAGQHGVSATFASRGGDRFAQTVWSRGPSGSPLIAGAAAWFDCAMHQTMEAGDHTLLIGRVLDHGHTEDAAPLGYCRGAYVRFGLSQEAVAATAAGRARVGAILERDRWVLLVEHADGTLALPIGARLEPAEDAASLRGVLRRLGAAARLDFLFAVFEDSGTGDVSVYYRGTIAEDPPHAGPARLFSFRAIPWDRLRDSAVASMMRRYVKERREDTFGIYVGDAEQGTVQPLAPPGPPVPGRAKGATR